MTEQLLLDLGATPAPSLDNFIPGRNGELLHALRAWLQPNLLPLTERPIAERDRCIYIWGEAGSGRTHLLKAMTGPGDKESDGGNGMGNNASRYVDAICPIELTSQSDAQNHAASNRFKIWAVDNVDRANAATQALLFSLINEVRSRADAAIVLAGRAAPMQLELREDLRTRLGWGPVFQVHPLNDAEKMAALHLHADAIGLSLPVEVSQYLLTHFSRDMPTLMLLLTRLDQYAMRHHRALTLPLLREFVLDMQITTQVF